MTEAFSLPATADGIAGIPERLTCLENWGVAARQVHEINLIIEEICANALEHGGAAGEEIGVRLELGGSLLTITISYPGPEFDPTGPADPDIHCPPEERHPGGLGLFLVRRFSDRLSYALRDGLNVVTVEKTVITG